MTDIKKVRKRRKPMTPEQRAEAAARLALAREKKKPAKLVSVAKGILELDDDDLFSYENVKKWIATQTEINKYLKKQVRENIRYANSKLNTNNTYLSQCKSYLRDGVWLSLFIGEYMDTLLRKPHESSIKDYEEVRILLGGRYMTGYRLVDEPNSISFLGRDDV